MEIDTVLDFLFERNITWRGTVTRDQLKDLLIALQDSVIILADGDKVIGTAVYIRNGDEIRFVCVAVQSDHAASIILSGLRYIIRKEKPNSILWINQRYKIRKWVTKCHRQLLSQ